MTTGRRPRADAARCRAPRSLAPTFEIDAGTDPPDLYPGDTLETVSEIRRGSVVSSGRAGPTRVLLRALSADEQRTYAGQAYRIDRGEAPGQLRLRPAEPPGQASA